MLPETRKWAPLTRCTLWRITASIMKDLINACAQSVSKTDFQQKKVKNQQKKVKNHKTKIVFMISIIELNDNKQTKEEPICQTID